jgi:predicted DNA-binding protein (MmcQ/YjbR family)
MGLVPEIIEASETPMDVDPFARLQAFCLSLPEAAEQETWDTPTFRVRNKIFAMAQRGDGRLSVWCKARPGVQEMLIGADSGRFFKPPYVGPKGWIGIRLDDDADWDEVDDLIEESYRMTAPKRLSALLGPIRADQQEATP